MNKTFLLSTVMAASVLAAPNMAYAQSAAQEPVEATSGLGEIVVTARKASERLQTTPVAVTAVTAEALQEAQITQVNDLQRIAPGLSTGTGGTGGPSIVYLSIRGQAQNSPNSASDSAVGTYVDGVYYGRPTSGNLGFLDVAQAEVLRGPQGTLFGRNTTGGALNITTVQPGSDLEGYALVGYGDYNRQHVEGAVTLPINADELSVRIAGRYFSRDGYIFNPTRNEETQDVDSELTGRVTVRWAPETLPLTLVVAADAMEYEDNGSPQAVVGVNANLQALGPMAPDIGTFFTAFGLDYNDYLYREGSNFDRTYGDPQTGLARIDTPLNTADAKGISANLNVDFSGWSLRSITAWREANSRNTQDLDGTPLNLIAFDSVYTQNQISEELQLSTTIGGLDLIAGLFYFKEEGDERTDSQAFGIIGLPYSRNLSDFESESQAVFMQGNYNFTDRLRATLGYRYTWDTREITRRGLSNINTGACTAGIPLTPQGCFDVQSAEFEYPAWTVGLDYRVSDDFFIYVKSSAASMAGGLNTRPAPAGQFAFGPEDIEDIEVGAKVELFDSRLRANVAFFSAENTNVQRIVNGLLGGRLTQYAQNAGDTETQGWELELTALPWEGMQIGANMAYLDATYKAGTFVEDRAGILTDRSGEPVPYAPEWQYSVSATQDFSLDYGTLTLHVDYAYTDDKVVNTSTATPGSSAEVIADTVEANRLGVLQGYGLINGRVSLAMESGLEIALWGRNLSDEEYFVNTFDGYNSLGFTTQNQGTPRTYGVELRYAF